MKSLGTPLTEGAVRAGEDTFGFVKAYARATGQLAKACEAWDHMEDLPYVMVMKTTNIELFKLIVVEAAARSIDLESLFRNRLRFIERRSIFHPAFDAGRG